MRTTYYRSGTSRAPTALTATVNNTDDEALMRMCHELHLLAHGLETGVIEYTGGGILLADDRMLPDLTFKRKP